MTAALGGRTSADIAAKTHVLQAVDEIIAIGREAKLPVQISHMKLGMIPLWDKLMLIHVLDRARASGVNITADVYPYPYWQSTLTVLYPNRDFEIGRDRTYSARHRPTRRAVVRRLCAEP